MLEELHVAGLGVVEEAWLELSPGLNVLTGETGAGKTMITVGLALALGARAAPGLVREGAAATVVEARFRLDGAPAGLDEWLDAAAPDEAVLARTVGAEGRSSARLSGRLAAVGTLAEIGARLVEIHGQHQTERLLSPSAQLAFLDRFAGAGHRTRLEAFRLAHAELRRIRSRLEALAAREREREREKDLLGYQIREIEAAGVRAGEGAILAEEDGRLAHAERIIELAAGAAESLGAEGGALDRLREAAAAVQAASALDRGAEPLSGRLAAVVAEAEDALGELRAHRERVEVDPQRLTAVRERIQALRTLERKYGDGEEGILAYLAEASTRLAELERGDAEREGLEAALAPAMAQVETLAAEVTAARRAAAPALGEALTGEVRELGMPGAEVTVALSPLDAVGPDGAEHVELAFSGGPGQPLRPLARAASGGELSRVMLACRSVLADLDEVPTIVFDEVDAGIGGRTAGAVGARLAALAGRRQVVVVTHLAQIAARADRHFLVAKDGGMATVRPIEGEERVEELARMLSGSTAGVSLEHARSLMGEGEPPPPRRARAGTGSRR